MVSAVTAERIRSVLAQLTPSIRLRPKGSMMNCPNDPIDMAMPKAMLRRSGGSARLMAPKTIGKVVPASPRPTRPPAAIAKPFRRAASTS